MEEKKSLKISLSTFFLFIAIIVIIIMAYYIYIEKINSNKEIADLEANSANMQNTIDDLQEKIDSISNTINSDLEEQEKSELDNNSAEKILKECYDKIIGLRSLDIYEYDEKEMQKNSKAEIKNYNEIINDIFTEKGKKIFEEKDLVDGIIGIENNKAYMYAGSPFEDFKEYKIENIKQIDENTIKCEIINIVQNNFME